jgi:methyltransferase (TIGR00027 family)
MLRAAHQRFDLPHVLDDPLALRIVGTDAAAALRTEPPRLATPRMRALRASVAVRSRYAEDRLAAAVAHGVRQYVLLGAGLDTFAFRNPHTALGVFEVDHPATQAWKRERLAAAGIAIPHSLTFAPVDFERETLAEGLRRAGFDRAAPAFFSWLGVTVYLTREAIMETLRFVASSAPGSEIVLTYVVSDSPLGERTAELGEPWITFFDPQSIARDLGALGFVDVEDLDADETNRRYFGGRADGLRVGGHGHLVHARVGAREERSCIG